MLLGLLFVVDSADAVENTVEPPSSSAPAGERPSTFIGRLAEKPPPQLAGSGEAAKKNVSAFIEWAGASTKQQAEIVVRAVTAARDDEPVMAALCEEAFAAQGTDHSRALVALSLLGEAKSRHAEDCFRRFLKLPLPEKGTVVEGEIIEQTALAVLQAKAVDGLAYLRSDTSDRGVIEVIAEHPSRIVRAEAIAAYLFNHDYSAQARETLKARVKSEDQIFLDRVVRRDGEHRESFNRKLRGYLRAHPEVRPPAPEKAKTKRNPRVGQPPAF